MNRFLSETYDRPKLVENKLVKKIITTQNNQITLETYIQNSIILFIQNNYKILLIILFIIIGLYWRHYEVKRKNKSNNDELYEEDTDVETTEEY